MIRSNVVNGVMSFDEMENMMVADMVARIVESDRYDKKCVMIMPNPCPTYRKVAYILKKMGVNCRNVKFYMMDEWADEEAIASAAEAVATARERLIPETPVRTKGDVDGIQNRNFLVHNNVRVIGHTVWYGVLSLK